MKHDNTNVSNALENLCERNDNCSCMAKHVSNDTQDCDYEAHISNTGKVSGKDELKQKAAKWNRAEEDFVNSCIDAMQNGDIKQEAMFDLHPEKFLVPSKKHDTESHLHLANVTQHRNINQQKGNYSKKVMTTAMPIIMIW